MGAPKVSVVVVNWNGWNDTIECLESVYKMNYKNFEIVLIDNGSMNDSVERIRAYCRGDPRPMSSSVGHPHSNKPIQIIEFKASGTGTGEVHEGVLPSGADDSRTLSLIFSKENLGFAEGCNIGIRHVLERSKPDYILLLNNDTVVDQELLRCLVEAAEANPNVGFAGPKTYYYDYHGRKDVINFAGGRLVMWKGRGVHIGLDEIDEQQHDLQRDVDYIEGSCMLARCETIRAIGLLDSSFFAYWEETDWCKRGWNAGYASIYVPKALIWHKVVESRIGSLKIYYMTRNTFFFMKKHASRLEYLAFFAYFTLFGFHFQSLLFALYNRNHNELFAFWKGVLDSTCSP
jgi:hypothetical protein